jgi:AcrR family transcriptional regulator
MPRAGLNQERVVAEAAGLADAVGYEGLTLAGVAERCGVRLPSLYKHVEGIAHLRRLLAARAVRELADELGRSAVGRSGADALAAMAGRYRDFARRHPGGYAATLRAPDPGDEALRSASASVLEVVFAILAGYGITGEDAVDATRMVRSALHGFVALEAAGGFGLPRAVDRSFARLVGGLDAALASWSPAPTTTRGAARAPLTRS